MKDLFSLMKDVQKIKAKMEDLKEQLKEKTVEGSAGGGMVKVIANGAQEIISVRIEDDVWQNMDKDVVEDLIVAAVNDALYKAKEMAEEEMKNFVSGLGIPIPPGLI